MWPWLAVTWMSPSETTGLPMIKISEIEAQLPLEHLEVDLTSGVLRRWIELECLNVTEQVVWSKLDILTSRQSSSTQWPLIVYQLIFLICLYAKDPAIRFSLWFHRAQIPLHNSSSWSLGVATEVHTWLEDQREKPANRSANHPYLPQKKFWFRQAGKPLNNSW